AKASPMALSSRSRQALAAQAGRAGRPVHIARWNAWVVRGPDELRDTPRKSPPQAWLLPAPRARYCGDRQAAGLRTNRHHGELYPRCRTPVRRPDRQAGLQSTVSPPAALHRGEFCRDLATSEPGFSVPAVRPTRTALASPAAFAESPPRACREA